MAKSFGDYLAGAGYFLLDTTRKAVLRNDDETVQQEREAGISILTAALYEAKIKDYANTHHIILIDGERLANLMIEYNFCVSTRKTFEIKAIDTDALAEYQDE